MPAIVPKPNNLLAPSVLELQLSTNSSGQTIVTHQHATHPLRISSPFRLDGTNSDRAYLYLRNNSPGLFAQDKLELTLDIQANTKFYLTEQSATKAHPMGSEDKAEVNYHWQVGEKAMVEFVPEPVILYQDSALEQTTTICLDETASLFWSDIILPGRLARGESYQFRYYQHLLEVRSSTGELWFCDRLFLQGKQNRFREQQLFSSLPLLGNAVVIMPNLDLNLYQEAIDNLAQDYEPQIITATSVLPNNKGILLKVLASRSQQISRYWQAILNVLRQLNNQSHLSVIPK